jgi:hypothetical protein
MFLWKLISALLDFDFQVRHWRSNLGLGGGVALAVLAALVMPWPHVRAIFAVALFLAGLICGLIWDFRSGV